MSDVSKGDARGEILDIYSLKRPLHLINSISGKYLALMGLCGFMDIIVRSLESQT